jgi:hypothetical protein
LPSTRPLDPVYVSSLQSLLYVAPCASRPLFGPIPFAAVPVAPFLRVSSPPCVDAAVVLASPLPAPDLVLDDGILPPTESAATSIFWLPPGITTFSTKAACETWAKANLDSAVLMQLNQPFGKDSLTQSFTVVAAFRHVLCPHIQSGILVGPALAALKVTYVPAAWYTALLRTHALVNFSCLRYPIPPDMPLAVVIPLYSTMFTALLLSYNSSVPAAVHRLGGTHTGAHRDHALILSTLAAAGVDNDILRDLRRIYLFGAPAYINAESTEANLRNYCWHGNHKMVLEDIPKTMKAMSKDVRRGYNIVLSPRLAFLIPHLHTTHMGMVDLQKVYKEPRPIFDSSFWIEPSSMDINDWCDKSNEPDIHFPASFLNFCVWIYNLRIFYPTQELYLVDDDVSGAFCHAKYNPNLVALHACLLFGFLFMSTGQTFGDCSSPVNFEPITCARQQYAQLLWLQPTTLRLDRPYLPNLQLQSQPTDPNVFTQSTPDSLNQGVFNPDGSRRSPTFDHHVDDNIYGDVEEFILLGVSASILALYLVLGYPSNRNRDPVSWNKFDGFFTHERKMIGYGVNSWRMVLFMLDHKRTQLLGLLDTWLALVDFDLLQCAELLGHLGSVTTNCCCCWACVLFFGLQNLLRLHLVAQYHKTSAYYKHTGRAASISRALPPSLAKHFESLVARDVATLLWQSKTRFSLTTPVRSGLQYFHTYLSGLSNPWEVLNGHVVPCMPNIRSAGDASQLGGGAINHMLRFWFDCRWNACIQAGVNLDPRHPNYVHTNCLEFIVLLLQIVAYIVYLKSPYDPVLVGLPTFCLPTIPILLALTNNISSKSWIQRVITASFHGQVLIQVYAALLRHSALGT